MLGRKDGQIGLHPVLLVLSFIVNLLIVQKGLTLHTILESTQKLYKCCRYFNVDSILLLVSRKNSLNLYIND